MKSPPLSISLPKGGNSHLSLGLLLKIFTICGYFCVGATVSLNGPSYSLRPHKCFAVSLVVISGEKKDKEERERGEEGEGDTTKRE